MSVAIIDYGSGNLHSAAKAFERVSDDGVEVTDDPARLAMASHIVLPGVGAFADCKQGLASVDGMIEALNQEVIEGGKPFLGICVGMQLMAARGLEHGVHEGFGWIDGAVEAIAPNDASLKIPHMGWNNLSIDSGHPVLAGMGADTHMYFVHSYHLVAAREKDVLATADYGMAITAVVGRANMVGTQFHPEKSQASGLRLIENFLNWKP